MIKKNMSNEYLKVSVGRKGTMHVAKAGSSKTLCGWTWWAENNHGPSYCRKCQKKLSIENHLGTEGKED